MMPLTQGILNELLRYEPETGKLYWRKRDPKWFVATPKRTAEHKAANWNSKNAEMEAFTAPTDAGYRQGQIFNRRYSAHRIIWMMVHGEWPDHVDHIDHDRSNNKLANLRNVTSTGNTRNKSPQSNNTSGATGVCWEKRFARWCARISAPGVPGAGRRRVVHLGYFVSKDDAIKARKEAESRYGYHSNHGMYAP